jgi:hypothetical protein
MSGPCLANTNTYSGSTRSVTLPTEQIAHSERSPKTRVGRKGGLLHDTGTKSDTWRAVGLYSHDKRKTCCP